MSEPTPAPDDDEDVEIPFGKISWWAQFPTGAIKFGIGCVVASILMLAFWLVMKIITCVIHHMLRKTKIPKDVEDMILIAVKCFMWVQLAPIVVGQTGLPMDSVITVIGAIVLGVGMALRPTVENFIAGGMLEFLDSFEREDLVCLAGGVTGICKQVRMSYVCIHQSDGEYVYLPNKKVYENPIRNFSRKGRMRVDVDFPMAVSISPSQVKKARRVMLGALGKIDRVLKDPEPKVIVKDITMHAVILVARVWVLPEHTFTTGSILNEALRDALIGNGLKFASRINLGDDDSDEDGNGLDGKADEDDTQGDIDMAVAGSIALI